MGHAVVIFASCLLILMVHEGQAAAGYAPAVEHKGKHW